MFWKSSHPAFSVSWNGRLAGLLWRFTLLSTTFIVGQVFFQPTSAPYAILYWSIWLGTGMYIVLGPIARTIFERLRFQRLLKNGFSDVKTERNAMMGAAAAIWRKDELLALDILKRLPPTEARSPESVARRWLTALAGVHWLARQTPFATLHTRFEPYPHIHALMHCHPILRSPLHMKALEQELERVTSQELDDYARGYIALIDALIAALNDPSSPFAPHANELLAVL